MTVRWVFDPAPPSGRRTGGRAAEYSFEGKIDTLVREAIQNSLDARRSDDQPVDMVFRVVDLDSDSLQHFLEAIAWPTLHDNLTATPEKRGGALIKSAIDDMEKSDKLRLLVIEDHGTKGLGGTEQRKDDEESNSFCALVRDELYSDKDGDDAGGSFGLGKSLLWAYSGLKTVLFSSVPVSPPEDHDGLRFIGRACLPYHETEDDGACSGDGWLGIQRGEDQYDRRADSVWGDEAMHHAQGCFAGRAPEDQGLSAVIVGFSEPGGEEYRSAKEIVAAIDAAALESFWPAIARRQLTVCIRRETNGDTLEERFVNPADEATYAPVVQLLHDFDAGELQEKETLAEGQSAVCWVPIECPERIAIAEHADFTGSVAVVIRLLPDMDDYQIIRDRIFRFRRPGMVVRDSGGTNLSIAARPYVAAVLGGLASGNSAQNSRIEQFLRCAEPPAHDEWTHNTRAIKQNYKTHGTRAKLLRFEQAVISAIRDLVSVPEERGGALPKSLLRHLRFGDKTGGPPTPAFITLSSQRAWIKEGAWQFRFSCRRPHPDDRPWHVRVRIKYGVDGGSGDDVHAISEAVCPDASRIEIVRGDALIELPAGVSKARIEGKTAANLLPAIGTRAAIQLRVDGHTGALSDA